MSYMADPQTHRPLRHRLETVSPQAVGQNRPLLSRHRGLDDREGERTHVRSFVGAHDPLDRATGCLVAG